MAIHIPKQKSLFVLFKRKYNALKKDNVFSVLFDSEKLNTKLWFLKTDSHTIAAKQKATCVKSDLLYFDLLNSIQVLFGDSFGFKICVKRHTITKSSTALST